MRVQFLSTSRALIAAQDQHFQETIRIRLGVQVFVLSRTRRRRWVLG